MSKFNLFESEYNLTGLATRRPGLIVRRKPLISLPFVAGLGLWFLVIFVVGYIILTR